MFTDAVDKRRDGQGKLKIAGPWQWAFFLLLMRSIFTGFSLDLRQWFFTGRCWLGRTAA